MRKLIAGCLILLALAAGPAHAVQTFVNATITAIQSDFLPGVVTFGTSAGVVCTGSTGPYSGALDWLYFNGGADTNKVVYATLLAAWLGTRQVHVDFETTTCRVNGVRPFGP